MFYKYVTTFIYACLSTFIIVIFTSCIALHFSGRAGARSLGTTIQGYRVNIGKPGRLVA